MPQQSGPTMAGAGNTESWAYAILVPTSIQADNGAGLREGIIGWLIRASLRKLG